MKVYGTFNAAIKDSVLKLVQLGQIVRPNNWQSMDVSKMAAAEMREILFHNLQVPMPGTIQEFRDDIKPNLPWADDHFELERVSREPINPGETWKQWPWANSAATFKEQGQFDHSYAERYWPRFAGLTHDGRLPANHRSAFAERHGVRDFLGDLDDVVERIAKDPTTRQAILSVWHPEDQFNSGKRVPCSLTYQFLFRGGHLHVIYNIRSCDAYRHFRDDIYLTCRLAHWVLMELRKRDSSWNNVHMGFYSMNVGSFHCFVNDLPKIQEWL